jgi:hypothetical protein
MTASEWVCQWGECKGLVGIGDTLTTVTAAVYGGAGNTVTQGVRSSTSKILNSRSLTFLCESVMTELIRV